MTNLLLRLFVKDADNTDSPKVSYMGVGKSQQESVMIW